MNLFSNPPFIMQAAVPFTPVAWRTTALHSLNRLFIIPHTGANRSQTMKKTKILVVTLLAGVVLHQTAWCQTNATGTSPAMTEGGAPPAGITADATGGNAIAGASESNAPASSASTNDATAGTGSTPLPATTATNMATAELPIQFRDVPITAAIESLARLAGINYLLDPRIGYGQLDQNGQPKPEPILSLRWEKVTARQALLALLDNYGFQLVENPKAGIDRITPKEPNALPPLITRVVQLKYASTSNMVAAVVSLLSGNPRCRVVPDARTSQLVVVATETEQADVDTLLNQLDKPTRQVLIETKLVELSSTPSTSKGIDWSGTLQAQNVAFGNGVLSGTATTTTPGTPTTTGGGTGPGGGTIPTTTPGSSTVSSLLSTIGNGGFAASTASGLLPDTGFLTADGVKAVLSFLNESSEAQVVSTPRLVTLDNETATISVTRDFPIINVTASTAGVSSGSSQITYSNIGTILQVTPRITANDYIWLKVVPDVSSYFATLTKIVAGTTYSADEFDSRHIETQVLIPNAHTLVMGGLVQDNPNASYTKVPILGDIPILGLAFRSEKKSMEKDNLLIFITPTIVRDADFKPATSDFLNSEPRTMQDSMNMHTWLDSAQPRGDWSNPLSTNAVDKAQTPDTSSAGFAP
jgi:type II secretory pathway component GspD/PulD (secretin)